MGEGKKIERFHMPTERRGVNHRFQVGDFKGYMIVNETVTDGGVPRPGELFLVIAKEGGTLSGFANAVAILTSMCLQYGVPLEVLCEKFIGAKFEPCGYVTSETGKPLFPGRDAYADSLLDYIYRWLAKRYLGEEWLATLDMREGKLREPPTKT